MENQRIRDTKYAKSKSLIKEGSTTLVPLPRQNIHGDSDSAIIRYHVSSL